MKLQREASAEFLQLAEASCDDGMLCVAHRIVGTTLMNMGEFAIARVHLEKAQDCYNPARHALLRFEFAQDIGATAACYLTWALWHLGHLAESRVCARAAVANTRELNHPLTLAYTLCHVQAMMDIFRQDDSAARMHAGSVIALADEHGFPFWAAGGRIIDGWAAARQGKADEGLRLLREGIAAWRRTGSKVWLPDFFSAGGIGARRGWSSNRGASDHRGGAGARRRDGRGVGGAGNAPHPRRYPGARGRDR